MGSFWLLTVGETLPMLNPGERRMRTAMLASELAGRGHNVLWWKSTFDHISKKQLFDRDTDVAWEDRLTVRFLQTRGYARNVSVPRYLAQLEMARRFLERARDEPPPSLIFASMPTPELAAAATSYGKARNVPVFVDIRDLWPDELLVRLPPALRKLGELLCLPMTRAVQRAMRNATGITAVSNSYLEWGLAHANRPKLENDRLFMMGYPKANVQNSQLAGKLVNLGIDPTKKIFLFVSSFNTSVDISTLIETARTLRDREDVQFVLCGDGEGAETFRQQARGLPNLILTGWMSKGEIAQLLARAYAGLVAYRKGTKVSLPNKFFEYLSAGVPVLVGLASDARVIAQEHDCGVSYEPENVAALSRTIREYADDAARRSRQSANATRFFEASCKAETVYHDLADFLEARAYPSSAALPLRADANERRRPETLQRGARTMDASDTRNARVVVERARQAYPRLVEALARMHIEVYPKSGLASYGAPFMRKLYEHLIEGAHSFVLVARAPGSGEVAGCLVVACDLSLVYKSFVRRYGLAIAYILAPKVFSNDTFRRIIDILRYPRRATGRVARDPVTEIVNLCVNPDWRRRGVAAALFDEMVAELNARHVRLLKIVTGDHQTAAQQLYESRGAALVSSIEVHRGEASRVYVLDLERMPRAEPIA